MNLVQEGNLSIEGENQVNKRQNQPHLSLSLVLYEYCTMFILLFPDTLSFWTFPPNIIFFLYFSPNSANLWQPNTLECVLLLEYGWLLRGHSFKENRHFLSHCLWLLHDLSSLDHNDAWAFGKDQHDTQASLWQGIL